MYIETGKSEKDTNRSVSNFVRQRKDNRNQGNAFVDNRPEALAQQNICGIAGNSPGAVQIRQLQAIVQHNVHAKQAPQGHMVSRNPLAVAQGSGAPIQRKIGFELEIPVTFVTDKGENVDTKMSYLKNNLFSVQGDKSSMAGKMQGDVDGKAVTYDPTIIELVTEPIDEHTESGQEDLGRVIAAVEGFQFMLDLMTNGYTEQTRLSSLASKDLPLVAPGAKDYIINAPTVTPRGAPPQTAYLHATVGVAIKALKRAGKWIADRGVEEYPGAQTATEGMELLDDPEMFGLELQNIGSDLKTSTAVWSEIENFIYLAYGQVRAIDRYEHLDTRVPGGGSKKNYTPFLSRSNFYSVYKKLSDDAQRFIVAKKEPIKTIIRARLHPVDQGGNAHTYLDEIFNQKVDMTQEKYFGGMVTRPPEKTGKVDGEQQWGVPVEVRNLGTRLDQDGVREKMGELLIASKSQFTDDLPYSPYALSTAYLLDYNKKKSDKEDPFL